MIYSVNTLINGDAETGDTTGWATTGSVSVVEGGTTEDGQFCFALGTNSSIKQNNIPRRQPSDFKVMVSFLPEEDIEEEVEVKLVVKLNYFGGIADEFIIPLEGLSDGV